MFDSDESGRNELSAAFSVAIGKKDRMINTAMLLMTEFVTNKRDNLHVVCSID